MSNDLVLSRSDAVEVWIGRRVITRIGVVPRKQGEAGRVDKPIDTPARSTLGQSDLLEYRVIDVQGTDLLITPLLGGSGEMVPIKDIVPVEKAVKYYSDLVRDHPEVATYRIHRASIFENQEDSDHAMLDLNKAIDLDPKNESAFNKRGEVWLGGIRLDLALQDFNQAIKLKPDYAMAYHNRGLTSHEVPKGLAKAIIDYSTAIRLDPRLVMTWYCRGLAHYQMEEFELSVADYSEAIRLNRNHPVVLNARAWIRATCSDAKFRDGQAAIEDAKRACELTKWAEVEYVETLAAAFAEFGDFVKAAEIQETANKMYTDDANLQKGRQRTALYGAKKPYRKAK